MEDASAFSWVGDVARFFGRLVPRIVHVDQTEVALFLKRGRKPKVLAYGLHPYWPFWTVCLYASNQLRVPKIWVTVRTKDRQTVRVGVRVAYTLWDSETAVRQALFKTEEVATAVPALSETVVARYMANCTVDELTNIQRTNDELTNLGRARLRSLGAEVQSIEIVDIAVGLVLIHENRQHQHAVQFEPEED